MRHDTLSSRIQYKPISGSFSPGILSGALRTHPGNNYFPLTCCHHPPQRFSIDARRAEQQLPSQQIMHIIYYDPIFRSHKSPMRKRESGQPPKPPNRRPSSSMAGRPAAIVLHWKATPTRVILGWPSVKEKLDPRAKMRFINQLEWFINSGDALETYNPTRVGG